MRIFQLIRDCYYWPQLRKTVKRYVRNYHKYQRIKTPTGKYQSLLKFLLILKRLWRYILVNFVGFLLMSNRINIIMIIID
jgi:hypothetical protein